MAKVNVQNVVAPGIGAAAGIMVSDMLAGWATGTKIGTTLRVWTPVLTSAAVGSAGLAFIPRGSGQMKAGGMAFAGAGFGLAIVSSLRALGILS